MSTQSEFSLHLIFSPDGWHNAKGMIAAQDRVFLLQDAVYLVEQPTLCESEHLYARALDCLARDITPAIGCESIDDDKWLELAEHAKNILSW